MAPAVGKRVPAARRDAEMLGDQRDQLRGSIVGGQFQMLGRPLDAGLRGQPWRASAAGLSGPRASQAIGSPSAPGSAT